MADTNYTPIDHLLPQAPTTIPPQPKKAHQPPPRAKESEPFTYPQEIIHFNEPLEHKDLDESVKPYVDVRKEKLEISTELKKIGLTETDPSLFKDAQNVKLPLSDDKIVTGLHAPITSALRWLAMFALYLLQQSHMTLKTVHGKVLRIVKK